MEKQKQFHDREHRFTASDLAGMNVTFTRSADPDEILHAEMLDFSKRGLKLKVPVNLHFEEKILIKIVVDEYEIWFDGEGSVRHIREDGEQSWIVGCAIAPTIRDEVIADLARASGKERRKFPRIKVYGEATIQHEGHASKRPAYIENISESGFCVLTPIEIPDGSRIKVEVQDRTFQYYSVGAVTHWQVSAEGGFKTGCSFADTSGYKQMLKCVSEQNEAMQGKEPAISRFVLTMAVATMLVPPFISLLWQSNSSDGRASAVNVAAVKQADPMASSMTVTHGIDQPSIKQLPAKVVPNEVSKSPSAMKTRPKNGTESAAVLPKPKKNVELAKQQTQPTQFANQPQEKDTPIDDEPIALNSPTRSLSPMREWVDNSGQFRIKAELIAVNDDSIEIRKEDGSIKTVPLDRLSREDLQYLFRVK